MDRVRFIQHRGKRVLLLDYSQLGDENQMLAMVEVRKKMVAGQPPLSLLTLTDVSGAQFTRKALDKIKEAAVYDLPVLKRAAMVGAESMAPKGALEAVGTFSARTWQNFPTREEALDWLVAEETGAAKAG